MSEPFRHPLSVRWAECDQQGVVFFAHYLAYADVGITELFRAKLGSYTEMVANGADMVVAEANVRYLASARFEDELELVVTVGQMGTTSMTVSTSIERMPDAVVLAEVRVRYVFVEPEGLTKLPIPDTVRDALAPLTA